MNEAHGGEFANFIENMYTRNVGKYYVTRDLGDVNSV